MGLEPKPPTVKGPADWFTGDVWIDPIARGQAPSRLNVSAVRFAPGARTAWHSHPAGQTLIVNFPGNPKSIGETAEAIAAALGHALALLTDRETRH